MKLHRSKSKPAIFLGKFQPPHVGHILTIIDLLNKYPNLALGITDGAPNNLSFSIRKEIFQKIFTNIECFEISGEIEKSTDNLHNLYKKGTVFLSGNLKVLNTLKTRNYDTVFVNRNIDDVYSGTKIRNLLMQSIDSSPSKICEFKVVPTNFLKPIEKVYPGHYENLEQKILLEGQINQPIIICADSGAVLDGSHRYVFLLKHGYKHAPVMAVNYDDESIFVGNKIFHRFKHTEDKWLTKNKILQIAYSGNLLPPRTTRHFFSIPKLPWPTSLNSLGKTEPISISSFLEDASIEAQIQHNKNYIEESHEEYEALILYLAEQSKTREYLRDQISMLIKKKADEK